MFTIRDVTLENEHVRLEPLDHAHATDIARVACDPVIWRYTSACIETPESVAPYIDDALRDRTAGTALPFAIIDQRTNRVVGSSRFGNLSPAHRHTEIGWTWLAPSVQGTVINPATKRLMLTHAFETWQCIRVCFRVDARNATSRAAVLRLGAIEEGTLHASSVHRDGTPVDWVHYRVLDSEWPAVKQRIADRLAARERAE